MQAQYIPQSQNKSAPCRTTFQNPEPYIFLGPILNIRERHSCSLSAASSIWHIGRNHCHPDQLSKPMHDRIQQLSKWWSPLYQIKETGIRIGEAVKIRWIDFDPEQHTIRVQAEKNSKPRIFRISTKLVNMLNTLPKKSEKIFPNDPRSLITWFREARKRIAHKLGNLRLKEIHFHIIRHWRATMLYHQTKDILHVKEFLGHKSLDSH